MRMNQDAAKRILHTFFCVVNIQNIQTKETQVVSLCTPVEHNCYSQHLVKNLSSGLLGGKKVNTRVLESTF